MKKNIKKIFVVLMFFILILSCLMTTVYGDYDWDFEQFDGASTGSAGTKIESSGATVIKIFQVIAVGVAILMLVVTGIMYVLSATTEKKDELKKHMPNYIIGVCLTFSAAVLLEIVSSFINANINN